MTEQLQLRRQNAVLANLAEDEWRRLELHFQRTSLAAEAILHHAHKRIEHAYFPLSGSVSLLTEFSDGLNVETAEIGNEGVVGVPLLLGQTSSLVTAKVLVPGMALRIAANALVSQPDQLSALLRGSLHQVSTQIACTMQLAACNAHHHLDSRLARRLLDLHDRTAGQAIAITHEGFATLLCAHRPSVSISIKRLERRGLVLQRKGSLLVIDRDGLEGASCGCHAIMRDLRNGGKPARLEPIKPQLSSFPKAAR